MTKILLTFSVLCLSATPSLFAQDKPKPKVEDVRFDEKALAKETTLPVFRNQKVVRSRTVETAGRLEVNLMLGKTLNDAFFDNIPIVGQASYHLNERHGIILEFASYSSSESSFVQAVRDARGTYDLSNVPLLKSSFAALWEYSPYYGKISFSKNTVYNISIYTTLGFGQLQFGNDSSSVFHAGLGQKLYFSPNWGIKIDLRAKAYQFPDFTKSASPAAGLDKTSVFNTEMTAGLLYMFN